MRKICNKLLRGTQQRHCLSLIGVTLLSIVLGCSVFEEKSKPFPQEYQGVWEGTDKTVLRIRENGEGDFISWQNDAEIEMKNCLKYEPKAKKITCENQNNLIKTFTIDKTPLNGEMKIGNIIFKREEDLSEKQKPSDKDLQKLVRDTILALNDSLQDKDFESYYDTLSKRYKNRTTPEKLYKSNQGFIDKKFDFSGISKLDAYLSSDIKVYTERGRSNLKIKGEYDTNPKTLFDFNYILEKDGWKLNEVERFATE